MLPATRLLVQSTRFLTHLALGLANREASLATAGQKTRRPGGQTVFGQTITAAHATRRRTRTRSAMRDESRRPEVKGEAFRKLYRGEAIRDNIRSAALTWRQMLSMVARRVHK
jgi:hypothetical protein